MTKKNDYIASVLETVKKRNTGEPEFLQAVTEVLESLIPVVSANKKYEQHRILERIVEQPDRIGLGAGFHGFQRTVDDALGDGFLAVEHQVVHELGQDLITILGIGQDYPLFGTTTT